MDIDVIFKQRKKKWDVLKQSRSFSSMKVYACKNCQGEWPDIELRKQHWICPDCGIHLNMSPKERIHMLVDRDSFMEMDRKISSKDPLGFPGYPEKLQTAGEKTDSRDAIVTGIGEIDGRKAAIGVFDSRFFMGSMGTVVGEKIARLAEYAGKKKYPLIIFSASGGARMQEGLFSLMQMSKTAAAIQRFKEQGGLFLSVLTNPTTGGVSASFASLGDIMIAEPGALICFAGPRVIEQTIGQKLPDGFQKAEFLLEHGMLDMILERKDQKRVISKILKLHGKG